MAAPVLVAGDGGDGECGHLLEPVHGVRHGGGRQQEVRVVHVLRDPLVKENYSDNRKP